jgi:2-polyprenyl-6-methoxyphenol hydroxylase-like FAD-dependent oxidoreductase
MGMAGEARECARHGDSMHGSDLPPSRQTLIIGSGMGGLAAALALAKTDRSRQLLVLERDAEPAQLEPTRAFEDWKRPGVPQLRHTHIFLGRFQSILRAHHPELLEELLQTGATLSSFDQSVPASLLAKFVSEPADQDLLNIWCRRATLEYVLRRRVERLPNVRFLHGTTVEGLLTEHRDGELCVTGVEARTPHGSRQLQADLVIDSSGARSQYVEQLRARGAEIRTERTPSECGYYCRHFRQLDPSTELPRRGNGSTLDYLVYGIFYAEDGHFSIAYACPEIEPELLSLLKRPDGFDEVCNQIPAIARWTSRARPVSRVFGGAELANRWHHFSQRGGSQVLGFFPVGDSHIQTNPIYGRGCSSAFVQAHALADALASSRDPREQSRRYHGDVHTLMRTHFQFCVAADAGFLARAKHVRGERMSPVQQLASHAFQSGFLPAVEESPFVAREWWKLQQMGKASGAGVFVLVLLQMVLLWLKRVLSGRRWQLPNLGPTRDEMLAACRSRVSPTVARDSEHVAANEG